MRSSLKKPCWAIASELHELTEPTSTLKSWRAFFLSELAKRGAEWNTVCRTVSRWLGKKTPSAATSRVSDSIKSCRKNEDGMRPKKSDPRPPCVIELLSPEKEALPEYSRGFGEILN
jgi:hypothetical protein